MPEIKLEQNTPEWLEYRKTRLGASDIAIILGLSKYKTALELWEEKTGVSTKEQTSSPWAQRGHDLEPIAREKAMIQLDMDFKPTIFSRDYLMASLDGWNAEKKIVLEIKCPGKADHEIARCGRVPKHYKPQIQTQMELSDANYAYYFSFDGMNSAIVKVERDKNYWKEIYQHIEFFWNCVEKNISPEITERDFIVSNDKDLKAAVLKYKLLSADKKSAEGQMEQYKKIIESLIPHTRTLVGDYKITRVTRAGAIDYSKIPELKNVDLEKYRKKSTVYTKID